ncbi:ERF family protein [Lactobacillus intestinalis]|uniref:ERF family protein n=1 Tax=Lactobacillus intestinalis TaxID=151781 RepID=UPI00272B2A28|nr:ERF family protein [Lactobacillus intestinalis]
MENLKLNQPKTPQVDKFGLLEIKTVGGLDAQQIVEAKTSLMSAYIQVQANIEQPKKDKDGAIFRDGGGYKYADLNSVIASIKNASKGIDIAFIQQPINQGGKSGVINYLINSKGAIINFGAFLLDVNNPRPQNASGSLTYARRYSISAIFGIASEDDTDAQEYQSKPEYMSPAEIKPISLVYAGERLPLIDIYAKASAGDTLAKQILVDKDNSAKVKVAVKSLGAIYNLNQQIEKENQERKKKEEAVNNAVKNIVDQAPQDPFKDIK